MRGCCQVHHWGCGTQDLACLGPGEKDMCLDPGRSNSAACDICQKREQAVWLLQGHVGIVTTVSAHIRCC
eukprot:6487494-Amphidinium_carterae.1